MGTISKNFKFSEFSRSDVADQKGLDNTIPDKVKPALIALVKNVLQPICDATEWHDDISSGYRSEDVNNDAAVKGASNSQHLIGEASDNKFWRYVNGKKVFVAPILVASKVLELKLDFDQMILYSNFVHISFTLRRKNRKEVLYNSSYEGDRL